MSIIDVFVCLGVFVSLTNFSFNLEMSQLPMKGQNFDPYSTLTIEQRGFFNVRATPTVTRDNSLKWSSPRTRDTHTCYWAFGIWDLTTCFNNIGLSRPGIEPRCPACQANVLSLFICSDLTVVNVKHNLINMRDNYVNMRPKLCCMSTYKHACCMLTETSCFRTKLWCMLT